MATGFTGGEVFNSNANREVITVLFLTIMVHDIGWYEKNPGIAGVSPAVALMGLFAWQY